VLAIQVNGTVAFGEIRCTIRTWAEIVATRECRGRDLIVRIGATRTASINRIGYFQCKGFYFFQLGIQKHQKARLAMPRRWCMQRGQRASTQTVIWRRLKPVAALSNESCCMNVGNHAGACALRSKRLAPRPDKRLEIACFCRPPSPNDHIMNNTQRRRTSVLNSKVQTMYFATSISKLCFRGQNAVKLAKNTGYATQESGVVSSFSLRLRQDPAKTAQPLPFRTR